MQFDDWFIAQFRDTLSEPLTDADGMADSEIDAAIGSTKLPDSVRAYFRVAGNHWLNTNYNEWLPLGGFETVGNHTIFMNENQCVVRWAFRNDELAINDPNVYQAQFGADPVEWHSENKLFSRFIIAMWQWVLTGESPA